MVIVVYNNSLFRGIEIAVNCMSHQSHRASKRALFWRFHPNDYGNGSPSAGCWLSTV